MKNITNNLKAVLLGIIVAAGVSYAAAGTFTGPACAPPNCNTDAPLNVGNVNQVKTGRLVIGTADSGAKILIDNVDGPALFAGGLLQSSGAFFTGPVAIRDGSQGVGKILVSDALGIAKWEAPTAASGLKSVSCPSYKFVKGFDAAGAIICSYARPVASIQLGSVDEQIVVNITGKNVTLTNPTRGGANLTSFSFADPSVGLPNDGQTLKVMNIVSSNSAAGIATPCPAGAVLGVPPGGVMGNGICVYQQPNASNGYTAKIWIFDGAADNHSWAFDVDYQ